MLRFSFTQKKKIQGAECIQGAANASSDTATATLGTACWRADATAPLVLQGVRSLTMRTVSITATSFHFPRQARMEG
jgi:hypothetical protein